MAKKGNTIFTYNPDEDYHIEALKSGNLTPEEMRKEYSRLRSVAQKRLDRLGKSEYSTSSTYRYWAAGFPTLSEIDKHTMFPERALMYNLNAVYRFLSSKRSSITGARAMDKKMVETLNKRGFGFITTKNLRDFGEYMEELRQHHLDRVYGSERAVQLYGIASSKGVDPKTIFDDFDKWNRNRAKLERMPKIQNGKANSSEDVWKALEEWERKATGQKGNGSKKKGK